MKLQEKIYFIFYAIIILIVIIFAILTTATPELMNRYNSIATPLFFMIIGLVMTFESIYIIKKYKVSGNHPVDIYANMIRILNPMNIFFGKNKATSIREELPRKLRYITLILGLAIFIFGLSIIL